MRNFYEGDLKMKSILALSTLVIGLALFNGTAQANPFGIYHPDLPKDSVGLEPSDVVNNHIQFGIYYPNHP